MFCGNCGSAIGEGRRFCGKCGAAVRAGTSTGEAAVLQVVGTEVDGAAGAQVNANPGRPATATTNPPGASHSGGSVEPNTSARASAARPVSPAPAPPARRASRPRRPRVPWTLARKVTTVAILVIVVAAAGTGWWWKHRPELPYQFKDPGVYPYSALGPDGHTVLFGFVNAKGVVVAPPTWTGIEKGFIRGRQIECNEGLCPVSANGKWGYVDLSGKVAIPPQFDSAAPFVRGLALVGIGNLFGFIDTTGRYVINPQFSYAGDFSDGLALAQEGGSWGFVDRAGHWAIAPRFADADPDGFSDGLAAVSITAFSGSSGSGYGYISKNGKFKIKPQFRDAGTFSDGLAPVQVGDKWGYINTSGSIVINPQFDPVTAFSNGYALVGVGGKSGTIDRRGNYVVNPGQYAIDLAADDLLRIRTSSGVGLLSRDGKWAVQPTSALAGIGPIYGKAFIGLTPQDPSLFVPISISGKVLAGSYKGASLASLGPDITNESNALASVRTLVHAEASYANSFPAIGFTASLKSLGPAPTGNADENNAGLIDGALATGSKDNYQFKVEIPSGTSTGGTNFNYMLTATPLSGHAGRVFCSDSTGVIRYATQGQSCTASSPAVLPSEGGTGVSAASPGN